MKFTQSKYYKDASKRASFQNAYREASRIDNWQEILPLVLEEYFRRKCGDTPWMSDIAYENEVWGYWLDYGKIIDIEVIEKRKIK